MDCPLFKCFSFNKEKEFNCGKHLSVNKCWIYLLYKEEIFYHSCWKDFKAFICKSENYHRFNGSELVQELKRIEEGKTKEE